MRSEFLESLYYRSADTATKRALLDDLECGRFRRPEKGDSNKTHVPIVFIQFKGNGERAVFHSAITAYADFGNIAEQWGFVYVYTEDGEMAVPRKFKLKSDRILIDLWRN